MLCFHVDYVYGERCLRKLASPAANVKVERTVVWLEVMEEF